jgi:hypothetical protein
MFKQMNMFREVSSCFTGTIYEANSLFILKSVTSVCMRGHTLDESHLISFYIGWVTH